MIDEDAIQQVVDMHAVYRLFSASDRLLYVGMTNNLGRRLDEHTGKRWFPQIKTITLEWFPTKAAASAAEKRAIRAEHPVHNIIHVPGRPSNITPLRSVTEALLSADQMTLSEAVLAGIFTSIQALRQASHRPGFPAPVGMRGLAKLYAVEDLRAFRTRRRKAS